MRRMLCMIARRCALTMLCLAGLTLAAQAVVAKGGAIKPSSYGFAPAAELRATPNSEEATLNSKAAAPALTAPFHPTIDPLEYERLKAADQQRPQPGSRTGIAPIGPLLSTPATAPLVDVSFEGLNRNETPPFYSPPDTHGAAGKDQFVEVVNTRFVVFDREGSRLKNVSLNNLVGYTGADLFDPRVVYDRTWDRWIVTAPAFAESNTVDYFFLAVSQTGDATGPFYVYRINTRSAPFGNSGELFDYPQLGIDQDGVIITANIFNPSFVGPEMFSLPKAALYAGAALPRVPVFSSFSSAIGTLAPPIVLGSSARTILAAAPPGGSNVYLYALTDSGRPEATQVFVLPAVNVGPYNVPRAASQPGTSARLDTLDARFQNASTQVGDSLFNVHTVEAGSFIGFPTPRWYEINTATSTVARSGFFFATATSIDFNPSITANDFGDVFVTWTSTDPLNEINAQVRASGALSTQTDIPAGSVVFQSPTFYTFGRWGDYSAVALDPLDPSCAWGVNEKIDSTSVWGSYIFRICFPAPVPVYQVYAGEEDVPPFVPDAPFVTGGHVDALIGAVDTSGVTNPAPQEVYQWKRTGDPPSGGFAYTFPGLTPGAAYTVRLHFADDVSTGPGQRRFHLDINGVRKLTDFDIFAAAGGQLKAVVREFRVRVNGDGQIFLAFARGSNNGNPLVCGIEVLAIDDGGAP